MSGDVFRPSGGDQVAFLTGADARHDAGCFADEVVIDFPSVAVAVDRMRRAFVADERPTSLATTIHLSPREAEAGATVPLEVPVRCTCAHCGGRGESWAEPCARCGGSGTELLRQLLHVTVPAGVLDGARFHFTLRPRHSPSTRIELEVLVS
jgi:hypothetical protein